MATHWDVFRGGQTVPSRDRISVSINAKYTLTLSKYTRRLIGEPEKVLVMFNKRENMIGLSHTHGRTRTGST